MLGERRKREREIDRGKERVRERDVDRGKEEREINIF